MKTLLTFVGKQLMNKALNDVKSKAQNKVAEKAADMLKSEAFTKTT